MVSLETQNERELSEKELKESEEMVQELDVQWQIYRALNDCEERDIELIAGLKNELRSLGTSNLGIEIQQKQ